MKDRSTRQIEAKVLQGFIALIFVGLGSWCLVAPASVVSLTVVQEHQAFTPLVLVCIAAFGAQACLAGLFAAFSIFTRWTYLAYGVALLPFLVFDWWFYAVRPLFNELILLDVIGNMIMLLLCWRGFSLLGNSANR